MPIYEYQGRSCDEKFELLRSMNASDADVVCAKCGEANVTKLLSAFSPAVGDGASDPEACSSEGPMNGTCCQAANGFSCGMV